MRSLPSPVWQTAPSPTSLIPNEVHLWRAELDWSNETLEQFCQVMTTEDWQRIGRTQSLPLSLTQRRAIASRGILRLILAHYMPIPAHQLEFTYGSQGKPALRLEANRPPLEFNLSHSRNLALYAIAQVPVGVDVEYLRPVTYLQRMVQRYFVPQELTGFNAEIAPLANSNLSSSDLVSAETLQSFFHSWTCKEAVLKALGRGIPEMRNIQLAIAADQITVHSIDNHTPPTPWLLHSVTPASEVIATVAVPTTQVDFSYWQFVI